MIPSSFNSLNNNFYPSPNSLKSEHYQPLLIGDMLNVQALAKESQKIKDSKEKRPN